MTISRTAKAVLMVRPYDFGYNEQTGLDNHFQKRLAVSDEEINRRANAEFAGMVDLLRAKGVEVLVLEPPVVPKAKAPDAIFPNNWLSTEHDGTLLTYPMKASNRRVELRLEDVEKLLTEHGYFIRNSIHVGKRDEDASFLEGTGSLIIDHVDEVVYAALSARCHPDQFANFIKLRFYKKGLLFETRDSGGKPMYHTNVMMSLGEDFAVVCAECIHLPEQRAEVLASLRRSYKDVIEISREQVEQNFCGNILALHSQQNQPLIVMSRQAERGFSSEQRRRLERHGEIVPVAIETIESVGGGSARCMMAEIFSVKTAVRQAM